MPKKKQSPPNDNKDTSRPADRNDQSTSADNEVMAYEDLQNKVSDLETALKTERADAINYRNRAERERADAINYAKAEVVKDLLPLIDEVELASANMPDDLAENKWAQGVSKLRDRLFSQLDQIGVEVVDPLGEEFDPDYMNAVAKSDSDEDKVTQVMQKGYRLAPVSEGSSPRVIRPAMVKV